MDLSKAVSQFTHSSTAFVRLYFAYYSNRVFAAFKQTPLLYASLYLALIPIFALYYTFFIPADFSHSNIKLEKAFHKDDAIAYRQLKESLEHYLGKTIKSILSNQCDGQNCKADDLNQFSFPISGFSYSENIFSFVLIPTLVITDGDVSLHLIDADNPLFSASSACELRQYVDGTVTGLDSRFTQSIGYALTCKENVRFIDFNFIVADRDTGLFSEDYSIPLEFMMDPSELQSEHKSLILNTDLQSDALAELGFDNDKMAIVSMLAAYEELSAGIQRTPSLSVFNRMLYFSAVTITTLGYGDIAPISDHARVTVTVESILGIVLIGLFLNSVAKEARGRMDKP